MNDLISRKALCDYALNQKDKSVTPNDIMRFPTAQPETHEKCTETHSCENKRTETHDWIPVTKALPRDDEDVIVTCLDDSGDTPYSYTTVAWHYKGMWVCDNMRCLFVIAWMPLPKPWEGVTG